VKFQPKRFYFRYYDSSLCANFVSLQIFFTWSLFVLRQSDLTHIRRNVNFSDFILTSTDRDFEKSFVLVLLSIKLLFGARRRGLVSFRDLTVPSREKELFINGGGATKDDKIKIRPKRLSWVKPHMDLSHFWGRATGPCPTMCIK
jgi:hypothetical protein